MSLTKTEFMKKVKAGVGSHDARKREENLPLDMINEITAGIEPNTNTRERIEDNNQISKEDKNMNTITKTEDNLEELEEVLNSQQMERAKDKLGSRSLRLANIERLKEVKGIGPKTLEKAKNYLKKSENWNKNSGNKDQEVKEKAKSLAQKVKAERKNEGDISSDKANSNRNNNNKNYFEVNVESEATVKGIKLKGHTGIAITDFEWKIVTETNAAIYNKCEVFAGNKDDNFDIWGKYTGTLVQSVNKDNKARFEFYLRGNNLTVTYWQGYEYKNKAEKMATRAILVFKKAMK